MAIETPVIDDARSAIAPVPPLPGKVVRHRYLALSAVVTVLTVIQTANGQWSSDMWFHVAAVRELIRHPFNPSNPGVVSAAAHPDFSPYGVVLGVVGHVLDVGPITILSVAAMVNLVLLLAALRLFVLRATANHRAPFWALLFVLLLWGPRPYRFSGFFNLNSIGFVLPYPSTFATAIALFVLAAVLKRPGDANWRFVGVVGFGTAVVVLVHPITGVWLVGALLAIVACRAWTVRTLTALALSGLLSLILILLWPYFSMLDVINGGGDYSSGNSDMYQLVLLRIFPVLLIGAWGLWSRTRADHRDPLAWMLAVGVVVYVYGRLSDNLTYGRSLALVVLVLAIAGADKVGRLETHWTWKSGDRLARLGLVALVLALAFGALMARGGLLRMVPTRMLPASVRSSERLTRPDDEYAFLASHVQPDDVVVGSNAKDNLVIPAIAGRTLSLGFVNPFVSDGNQRAAAQRDYLDPATSSTRREGIQHRYKVRFALLHPQDPGAAALTDALVAGGGKVVYANQDFRLVRVSS